MGKVVQIPPGTLDLDFFKYEQYEPGPKPKNIEKYNVDISD
jgi:hypothetical protein